MNKFYSILILFCILLQPSFAINKKDKNLIFLSKDKFDKDNYFVIDKSNYLGNLYKIETYNQPIIHIASDTLNYTFEDFTLLSKMEVTDSSYFEYWFRVFVDTSMANKIIGINFLYTEPLNIFWDNKIIGQAGSLDVKKNKAINEKIYNFAFPFYTGKAGFHNLIIKQYRRNKDLQNKYSIESLNINLINNYNNYLREEKQDVYSLSTVFIAEGFRFFLLCGFVISLLFYFIVKRDKTFFWYSLLCFCILGVSFSNFFGYNFDINNSILGISILFLISISIFSFLAFLFQHFVGKIPKRIYYYSFVFPLFIFVFILMDYFNFNSDKLIDSVMNTLFFLFLVIIIVEVVMQLISAVRNKKKRVLFIAIGVLQFLILYPSLLYLFPEFDKSDLIKIASIYFVPISFLITVIFIIKDSFTENIAKQAEVITLSQANGKILQEQNVILEQKVKERTVELVEEKQKVDEKNRAILDSIEYALRIQTAILPPPKIVKQYLDKSFILYKPKDIVAGDFYWMDSVILKQNGEELILFAACDCTGHGVPGAMVSVVCHNALNRAVREYGLTQPSAILDKTAEIVLENFSKSEEEIQDGMDISICALNTKTKTLEWAGANNSLLLISNGKLVETKADKQCIGFNDNLKPFTNHQFNLQPDTSIYLFTDGYADQFGGHPERKLTKSKFKELLLSINNLPIQQQVKELDDFITNYKQSTEQTDDILVIGVKV